ncbi:hypothetical protein QOZ96_001086 [Brevundimonas nasdae]|uniref:hypothetical protein n=1 Tax=Brevundimonas nasdae TaxID=172043 RepID=UPI001911FEA8|nr:hypothetical protein [Brevundimonas nasdae]MBK6024496.1 hypothetical protein [Brevundimonas nasdae]MDQ0451155.1 hypothetical protein [Brevundimonas nasdae]
MTTTETRLVPEDLKLVIAHTIIEELRAQHPGIEQIDNERGDLWIPGGSTPQSSGCIVDIHSIAQSVEGELSAMLSALPPREEASEGSGAWSKDDIEDLISDALSDSFDLDWDAGDGAKAVLKAIEREGLLAALRAHPQPEQGEARGETRETVALHLKLLDTLKPFAEVAEKLKHCHVVEICEPTPDNPSRNIMPMPREWFERAGDDLEAIAIRLHADGALSEGQASKLTGMGRIEIRREVDRLAPVAGEGEVTLNWRKVETKALEEWRAEFGDYAVIVTHGHDNVWSYRVNNAGHLGFASADEAKGQAHAALMKHLSARLAKARKTVALYDRPSAPARSEALDEGAAGEPVAGWRYRRKGRSDTRWTLCDGEPRIRDTHDVQPLYTHPSPTPAADAMHSEPDDPTEEMIQAGLKVDFSNEDERGAVINLWHVMKAAAPPAADDDRVRVAVEALESIVQQAEIADDPNHHTLGFILNRANVALNTISHDGGMALTVTEEEVSVLLEVMSYAGDEVTNASAANSLFLKAEALAALKAGVIQ